MYTPVGIELPEYYEWVRGTAYPKVSPGNSHGRLQIELGALMLAWGRARGIVAAETDMNIRVTDDDIRRYLPDIQFTSWERLDANGVSEHVEIQDLAPDIAVEIVSPSQSRAYFDEKVRAYLIAGATVVLVVDTGREEIVIHRMGSSRFIGRGERFEDADFPGLVIDVSELFDSLTRR